MQNYNQIAARFNFRNLTLASRDDEVILTALMAAALQDKPLESAADASELLEQYLIKAAKDDREISHFLAEVFNCRDQDLRLPESFVARNQAAIAELCDFVGSEDSCAQIYQSLLSAASRYGTELYQINAFNQVLISWLKACSPTEFVCLGDAAFESFSLLREQDDLSCHLVLPAAGLISSILNLLYRCKQQLGSCGLKEYANAGLVQAPTAAADNAQAALLLPPSGLVLDDETAASMPMLKRRGDLAMLELSRRYVKHGRIVALVNAQSLSADFKQVKDIRSALIASGELHAVCLLPRAFNNASSVVQKALLFIDTMPEASGCNDVTFIDLSDLESGSRLRSSIDPMAASLLRQALSGEVCECAAKIERKEIIKNGFDLNPAKYLSKEASLLAAVLKQRPHVLLKDAVDIIRCRDVKAETGFLVNEMQVSCIDDFGLIDAEQVQKEIKVDVSNPYVARQVLQQDDIIFAAKAVAVGRCALIGKLGKNCTASQFFLIFRLKKTAPLSVYDLFYFLRSDFAKAYLDLNSSPTGLSGISAAAVENMPVLLPAEGEDNQKRYQELLETHAQIKPLQRKALALSEMHYLPETSK